MNTHDDFHRDLAEAARSMSGQVGTQLTLERAVQMATDMVDACEMASIAVAGTDQITTPAATDETLRKLDELQHEMGEGPCLRALRQTDVVLVSDLAKDPRWPRWGPYVAEQLDLHSSLSLRLFTTGDSLGVLNLYSTRVDAFTSEDLVDGLALAAHVAIALSATLEENHLHSALETRRMIGEATGIIRERFGLTGDQAFGVLRRMSQTHNIKLRTVAQMLVETGHLPEHPSSGR